MVITRVVIVNSVGLSFLLRNPELMNTALKPSNLYHWSLWRLHIQQVLPCKGVLEPSVSRKREPGLIKPRCIGCIGIFSLLKPK